MGRLRGAAAATVLAALALAAPAGAAGSSLPRVPSGHRPGPDALYLPSAIADTPQLRNRPPWTAKPILVSGADAYRDGEWLYQDFLYDDHGALGTRDPSDPFSQTTYLFSPKSGTLTYPTGPAYANNAADLVELRIRPLADATAFRVTLNTLEDPAVTAFTIALGTSGSAVAWPHGAGVSSPAARFLTVHGTSAELLDAGSGRALAPAPTATVDAAANQVDVRVPHAAWDPGRDKVRVEIGTGLWDAGAGAYAQPGASATATQPGGASASGAALFNVGPRLHEPMPDVRTAHLAPGAPVSPAYTIGDAAAGAQVDGSWWREHDQAVALATGDVSAFSVDVDFRKLAASADDEADVPRSGPMDRILATHYPVGEGVDYGKVCGGIGTTPTEPGAKCQGPLMGALQPYAIYVPKGPAPAGGYGLTLLLHSLSANYNQYLDSRNQAEIGDHAGGVIVVTPDARAPDGNYAGLAETDTFEAWADAARLYRLDPDFTDVTGYSMGGFGTYRLAARYPDLFARAWSVVGAPDDAAQDVNLRNVPLLTWSATEDELVNLSTSEQAWQSDSGAGLDVDHWLFNTADHLTLATNDEYGPGVAFLGDHRVDRDPPHVTFAADPGSDSAADRVVADHAYWVSEIRRRDGANAHALLDVRSEGFGTGDAPVLPVQTSEATLDGGGHGPMPYTERRQARGPAPAAPRRDVLDVKAANVASAVVDAARARVSCAPQVNLTSDGPLDLRIACPAAPRACAASVRVRLPRVRGRRVVRVDARVGARRLTRRGRNLRSLAFRRPARAFTLRLRLRTSGRHPRTLTVTRRYRAC